MKINSWKDLQSFLKAKKGFESVFFFLRKIQKSYPFVIFHQKSTQIEFLPCRRCQNTWSWAFELNHRFGCWCTLNRFSVNFSLRHFGWVHHHHWFGPYPFPYFSIDINFSGFARSFNDSQLKWLVQWNGRQMVGK